MSEATKSIFGLIPKIMAEVGAVPKNRRNPQQGYAFRGIDDVYAALQGPMAAHGVFVVPRVIRERREERTTAKGTVLVYVMLRVSHTFYGPDGSSVEAITVGEAMDSGDKASNKAMAAAMKYALIETFCLPTEGDNDSENQSPAEIKPRLASAAQVAEIRRLVAEHDLPVAQVGKWLDKAKAKTWAEMPADVITACIEYARRYTPPGNGELDRDESTSQEPRNGRR